MRLVRPWIVSPPGLECGTPSSVQAEAMTHLRALARGPGACPQWLWDRNALLVADGVMLPWPSGGAIGAGTSHPASEAVVLNAVLCSGKAPPAVYVSGRFTCKFVTQPVS
jgi:hypothetical protein